MDVNRDLPARLVVFGVGGLVWSVIGFLFVVLMGSTGGVRVAEPAPAISPTASDTPTDSPTDTPTETPTDRPTEVPAPMPTPTELPLSGVLLPNDPYKPWDWSPEYWRIDGFDKLVMTHNGSSTGFGDQIVRLQRGQTYRFGISDFEVLGVLRVEARDVWALDLTRQFDLSIMTCSGYNPVLKVWRYRVFAFLRELPRGG